MPATPDTTQPRKLQSLAAAKGAFALCVLVAMVGCGQESQKPSYKILNIQDFSRGRVGRFNARVAVPPEMDRETVRTVVHEVTAQVVSANRADVCWVLVHTGEPATMDNLLASAQWVSPAIPKEDSPYIKVSNDEIRYAGAPIYIIWH